MVDVLIIYDSNTGNTEKAAVAVLEGAKASGASATMKKLQDATEVEMRDATVIVIGSPCIHDSITGPVLEFLGGRLRNAGVSGKIGAAFGSYKWNGGNLPRLEAEMRGMGMRLVAPGVNSLRAPNDETVRKLRHLGAAVAAEAFKLKS